MKTVIEALGTANPPWRVSQREAHAIIDRSFALAPAERELYRRILLEGPIDGRHIGMDSAAEVTEDDQDKLVARFLAHGRRTAAAAARQALERAGVAAAEVGAVIVNTCTGYLCPGLSSYLAEELALPAHVRPLDIMGMGCGAALPNLEAAHNLVCARPDQKVLSVAVEICTATLFMDPDPGVVASNCIFGDGAAAAVVSRRPARSEGGIVTLLDFESGLYPQYRANLHYRTERHRLRNVLTREVPVIGARVIAEVAQRLLQRHRLRTEDIRWWAVHAGGTQVLDAVVKKMVVGRDRLSRSYEIFREFGNMSSPTALFVLDRLVRQDKPPRGERGLILTFGAGFTAFAALVEF